MKKALFQFSELTLDQKRYVLTGLGCFVLLLVYAMSRVVEKPTRIVEMAKQSEFKNGNLTTDETSTYYRSKDELARKQYERVMESQKQVTDRLAEVEKRLGTPGAVPAPGASPTVTVSAPPVDPTASADSKPDVSAEGAEKKWNRRGQNQSRIKFPLAMLESAHILRAA